MRVEQYESLTPTEREVLRRLGLGARPGEIAGQLGRSVSTVNNHLQAARTKLSVSDSLSAARALLAYEGGGQTVPRHDMPMEGTASPPLPAGTQHDQARPSVLLDQEHAPFEQKTSCDREWAGDGRLSDAATVSHWRKIGAILALTLLLLACIALAPAMAETFQRVIDLIYPIPP